MKPPAPALPCFKIVDFGATGDGFTLDTAGFDPAIATCHRQGEAYSDVNDRPEDGPVQHKLRPGSLILLYDCHDIPALYAKVEKSPTPRNVSIECEDVADLTSEPPRML